MPNPYRPRRRWLTRLARTLKFITLLFLLTFGLTAAWNTTIPTPTWYNPTDITMPVASPPITMMQVESGEFYLGNSRGGVYRWAKADQQWHSLGAGGWGYAQINDLKSYKGKLYVGTTQGLYVWDEAHPQWRSATTMLKNSEIRFLQVYQDTLYIGVSPKEIPSGDVPFTIPTIFSWNETTQLWQNRSHGLTHSVKVNNLQEYKGNLYLNTDEGIFSWDEVSQQWQAINMWMGMFLQTYNGVLYASYKNQLNDWIQLGVFTVDNVSHNSNNVYRLNESNGNWDSIGTGLEDSSITALQISDNGEIYVSQFNKVYRWEQNQQQWQPMEQAGLSNATITHLQIYEGVLYAGCDNGGVYRWDKESHRWQAMSQGLELDTPLHALESTILRATNESLYASSGNKVYHWDQEKQYWQAMEINLPSNGGVTFQLYDGELYMGVERNFSGFWIFSNNVVIFEAGIYRWDKTEQRWQNMSVGLTNRSITVLQVYQGDLYAGTNQGEVYFWDKINQQWQTISLGLGDNSIENVSQFVVLGSGWGDNSEDDITDLEVFEEVLYAANSTKGVYRWDKTNQQWQAVNLGFKYGEITDLQVYEGTIYASSQKSIYRWDKANQQWQAMNSGLGDNDITALQVYQEELYMGSNKGVYRWNKTTQQWQALGSNGLSDNQINSLQGYDGSLYVSTNDGVFQWNNRLQNWQAQNYGLSNVSLNRVVTAQGKLYAYGDYDDKLLFVKDKKWQIAADSFPTYSTFNMLTAWTTWGAVVGEVNGNLIWATTSVAHLPLFDDAFNLIRGTFSSDDKTQVLVVWGYNIAATELPWYQLSPLPVVAWRVWVWQQTPWAKAQLWWFLPLILSGVIFGVVMDYINYTRPFRLPLWAVRLTRSPENLADSIALNEAWPEWAEEIKFELLEFGDVHPDDLRPIPALFRRYALKRYLADYSPHEKVELRGATLYLLATPQVQAWQRAWAQISRTLTTMPHLADTAHAPIQQLTDLLAEALGLANLSAPHHFKAVRAYQVEAPLLRLRLPQRFPLIYLADPRPNEATIQMLVDAVEVLKESGYFALVITLEPRQAGVDVAAELRQAMSRSAHVQDFISLSGVDVLDLLIARDPITKLTRQILRQVDLAVVSPFVVNGPVPESMFFGREAEVKQLVEAAGRVDFALLGNRKIGKTSLLRRAFKRLQESGRVQPIWLDCQAIRDTATFLATFVEQSKITLPELTPLAFQQALRAHPRRLVLFIDEAEYLLEYEQAHGETLVSAWRALAQAEVCHFIFAGSTGLARQLDNPQSAFFNFPQRLTLGYLDETTLGSVISQPLDTLGLLIDDRDGLLTDIYRLTSGHPNVAQYLGAELIKAANLRQERLILRADLATLEQSGDFMDYFVSTIWGEAPPLAKLITLLAPADSFTFSELEAQFHAHNLPFDDEAVTTALRLLRMYAVLQQQGQRYDFIPRAFRPILHAKSDVNRQIKQVAKSMQRI